MFNITTPANQTIQHKSYVPYTDITTRQWAKLTNCLAFKTNFLNFG